MILIPSVCIQLQLLYWPIHGDKICKVCLSIIWMIMGQRTLVYSARSKRQPTIAHSPTVQQQPHTSSSSLFSAFYLSIHQYSIVFIHIIGNVFNMEIWFGPLCDLSFCLFLLLLRLHRRRESEFCNNPAWYSVTISLLSLYCGCQQLPWYTFAEWHIPLSNICTTADRLASSSVRTTFQRMYTDRRRRRRRWTKVIHYLRVLWVCEIRTGTAFCS